MSDNFEGNFVIIWIKCVIDREVIDIYLHDFAKNGELCFGLFELLLILLVFWEFESFFGDGDKCFTVVLAELLDAVLVDWFAHVKHFESALGDTFDECRVLYDLDRLAGDEVDVFLAILHAGNIISQGGSLFTAIDR